MAYLIPRILSIILILTGFVENHSLKKRTVLDFGDMVIGLIPRRNPMEFAGYGNYCGMGGTGDPVDKIDECCMAHDNCYNNIEASPCAKGMGILYDFFIYLEKYKYKQQDNQIICSSSNSPCSQTLCTCDKNMAECLAANEGEYVLERRNFIIPGHVFG